MQIVHQVSDLRALVRGWREQGEAVALVPTMGGLHEGHLSLVKLAQEKCDRVITTIFVNPAQFGPEEDLENYPSNLEKDSGLLNEAGADALFAPSVAEIYPDGFATSVSVTGLTDCLCGAHRPGHFAGVTTVVAKLLLQSLPDAAIFGEKDYQQLQVIRRFVRDLDIPVEIFGAPTRREPDGLAMSSRNAYLTDQERKIAPALFRVLSSVADQIRDGELPSEPICQEARQTLLEAGFQSVDYLEVRDAESLVLLDRVNSNARIFGAANLGRARLIDNVAV